ncbi:MAG: DUF4360 domain-containing protein [Pseudobdellovibrionaceae bacterium]
MKLAKVFGFAMGLVISSAAFAQQLSLGQPAYGGSGCPAGTASATVSPDGSAVSILFDQYVAEAGSNGKRIDRKSCNLAIPVNVPQGYSVALLKLDYRGYNAVPSGGRNQFNVEYFWAGSRGPSLRRTFTGPENDTFTLTDELVASTLVWSACGAQVNFRVNTSMVAQANSRLDDTIASLDSADVSGELLYHFQFRRCNGW